MSGIKERIIEWENYVEMCDSNYHRDDSYFDINHLQPLNYFVPMGTWIYLPKDKSLENSVN